MGKFDEQIARNKEYFKMAEEDLKDLANGISHSINGVDMAPEIKKRAEANRDLAVRLIAAYEKRNV